ncbi:DinB family protein [Chloroflexi bacterium TSY]|nr:DinB family protein [Chloroflexi bacterium TSY]
MTSNKKQDESLMTLFDKARTTTLSVVRDVSEEQARWLPDGEVNHILWHAGHIFVLLERCVFAATVGSDEMPPSIPEGWWPLFGWNSKPWEFAADAWPSIASVRQSLEAQTERLQRELSSFDDAFLSSPIRWSDPRWNGRPTRIVIVHGFYDELLHSGQMMQLKRMFDAYSAAIRRHILSD